MRLLNVLACAALAVVIIAAPVAAESEAAPAAAEEAKIRTLEGKIVCAKCALHEEGRDECQNVLVVEKDGKTPKHFYLTKNAVYEQFGEVCMGSPLVRITGEVSKQDGRTWLTASEISKLEPKG